MERCQACGSEEPMPFNCHYCRRPFCPDHRLPESHECPELWMARPPSRQPPRARTGFRSVPLAMPSFHHPTSGIEVKHLLVAWLVLGFAFSLAVPRWLRFPLGFPLEFAISLGTVGLGFILHELAHKFMAQRYGLWAEFRMSAWGLMMAIIFAFISGGSIIFAAPGATIIASGGSWEGGIAKREGGTISLAGPITNVVLALAFFPIRSLGGLLGAIGAIGLLVNLWLAAFNMIPFGLLDGRKVLRWSPLLWAWVAIPLWLLIALQLL